MKTGAYIFGCAGQTLAPDEAAFFRDADPWGFILFSRNIEAPDQIRRLTASLREAVGRDAPILIDQEGGRVQRLEPPQWRAWSPPLDHAEGSGNPERSLWLRYRIIAQELRDLGIDVNCAPCLDIAFPETHPFLRNRCYGTNPDAVIARGRAVADGCLAGGVLPILKHMPGHGRGTEDSHLGLPVTDAFADDLLLKDFKPFAALADLPLGMTAHMLYTEIDAHSPSTTSRKVIDAIRADIAFTGLLMTDDLSMEALGGTMTERTRASLDAGCDIVLHCNGDRDEMEDIAAEAGRLSVRAENRSERALAARRDPDPIDIAEAEAELAALDRAGA